MRAFGWKAALTAVSAVLLAQFPARAQPADLQTTSDVRGVVLAKLGTLPRAPDMASAAGTNCEPFVIKPSSEAGHQVAGRGWSVTGEARLGPFQLVSFAGELEPSTSGTCDILQGNIGVFDGSRLIALAYVARSSKLSIGNVKPLEGGKVRVWSGDVLPAPIGDLEATNQQLRLGPVAAQESLCGGRAIVPNIYDFPIDKARKALSASGWTLVKRKLEAEDEISGPVSDLVHRGVVETDSCSGTGFGFCGFKYKGPGGSLTVVTAGEWDSDRGDFPHVVNYDVTCR